MLVNSYPASASVQSPQQFPFAQPDPQRYVTLLAKVPGLSPSPWIVYPTATTIWVVGIRTGTPPSSQIREFFIDGTSKPVLNLTNVFVSGILADPTNPSGKLWFTENSTLAYYQNGQTGAMKAITLATSQSLQYLAADSQNRIWMTSDDTSGTSYVVLYNPADNSNKTFPLPTNGAIAQGLTVAADNTIWFAEAGSKKIGHLIPSLNQTTEYSPPSTITLSAPIQVAVDSSGNVWFTDHGSNQFGVLNPSVYPSSSAWKVFPIGYCSDNCVYGLPNAIFLDKEGTIWFSEHIAGRVGRYDPITSTLVEYSIPGSVTPLMWWAMPGPNKLVWFVAWSLGQVGYVNASIPIPFSSSGPAKTVVIQKGTSVDIPVKVSSLSPATLSFGLSPLTPDQSFQSPQIYGTSPTNLTLNNNSQTISFRISAAWNATLGSRYLALTASDGEVSINSLVLVQVVESSVPFVALAVSSTIVMAGVALLLPRRRKRGYDSLKKNRR